MVFNSTFDGVYRSKARRKIHLWEHKTAKQITLGHLPMDDQGGSYFAVASIVLKHEGILSGRERIDGINYNFLRKGVPDERPKDAEGYATNKPKKEHFIAALQAKGHEVSAKMTLAALTEEAKLLGVHVLGDRSLTQSAPLFHREYVTRTRREQATQIDRLASEALLADMYRDGTLPVTKTPTRDCEWDCAFYNMCLLHEQSGDWTEFRDAVFLKRDPYDRYRMLKSA